MIGERDILLPKLMILAGIVALAVLALFTMKYPIPWHDRPDGVRLVRPTRRHAAADMAATARR